MTTPSLRPMDARLDGYVWLPRMIDKSRAHRAGTLGDIVHPCPIDRRCLRGLGIGVREFGDIVAASASDAEVLERLRRRGIPEPAAIEFDPVAYEAELQGADLPRAA